MPAPSRRYVMRHLLPLGFFALVGLLALYWPLFNSGALVPGSRVTDYHLTHWSLWWGRHALSSGLDVYFSDYVMFPGVHNLAYHTLALAWMPLWALLEPLVGTIAAVDVILWLGVTLSGWLAFLLLRQEGALAALALPGGVGFALMPSIFAAIFWSNINLVGWFWLPAALLLWNQVARAGSWRRALLWAAVMGAALWLMLLTDAQYALFAGILLVPYGLWTLVAPGRWHPEQQRGRLVVCGIIAVAIGGALLWFAGPLPALRHHPEPGQPADLAGVESMAFPGGLLGRDAVYWLRPSVGLTLTAFVLLALLVSLRSKNGDRARWFWFAAMLPPLVIAVGPGVNLFGVAVTMPYTWIHDLLGGTFRYPGRFLPAFTLAALLFITLALTPRLRRWAPSRRAWAVIPALLLVLADLHAFASVPVTEPVTPYAFYAMMGQERGAPYDDYVVIEVPVAAGTGVQWIGDFDDTALQFHALTHGKRMVNGLLSRANPDTFWPLRTDDLLLSWLGQRRWLEPEAVRAELARRIDDWPIGYIVVHQDRIDPFSPTPGEIIGYFNQLDDLLCPAAVEGPAIAYRTRWHPAGCATPRTPPEVEPGVYHLDIGAAEDVRYLGWGWHWPEAIYDLSLRWAGDQRWTADDPRADLYVDLPPGSYEVTLALQSFWEPRPVTVRANGQALGTVAVDAAAFGEFSFALPAAVVGDGQHVAISIAYDTWTVPVEVGQSEDERILSVAVDWVSFRRRPTAG